jgi:hypothetical protein
MIKGYEFRGSGFRVWELRRLAYGQRVFSHRWSTCASG